MKKILFILILLVLTGCSFIQKKEIPISNIKTEQVSKTINLDTNIIEKKNTEPVIRSPNYDVTQLKTDVYIEKGQKEITKKIYIPYTEYIFEN